MIESRWRLRVLLLASAIAVVGCATPDVEPDVETTSSKRRAQSRERLRGVLGDRYDAPLPAATDDEIRRGSNLYDLLCRACHGPTGTGTGRSARLLQIRPQDLTDPTTAAFFSDQAKLRIIAEGIDGTPMIGWSNMLDENERLAVLHFMNTLIREPPSP